MSEKMGRRDFLKGVIAASGAAALAGGQAEVAQAQEKPKNLEQSVLPIEKFEEEALASLVDLFTDDVESIYQRADVFGSRILSNYGPLEPYNRAGGIQTTLFRESEQARGQLLPAREQEIAIQGNAIQVSKDAAHAAYRQFRKDAYSYLRFVQNKRDTLEDDRRSGHGVRPETLNILNKSINPAKVHATATELADKNNALLRILAGFSGSSQ